MDKLFFVEHFITDKEAWKGFMSKLADVVGDEDMTVDKGLQYPEWEGNEPLLTIADVTGTMTVCLWKLPSHATTKDFQEFIDRFTCGASTNKVYAVKETIGAKRLESREWMRDFIHSAQGKERPGYLDRPMLWMTHHQITDKRGWEDKVMEEMAAAVRKDCTTPSDAYKLSPKGHGTSLVLFLSDNTCMCFDGSPAGMKREEYQKFVDEFTKGTAKNTVYNIDPKECINMVNLSEDVWNQEFLEWGNTYVNPNTKAASHEATDPMAAHGIHITSQ